MVGPVTARGGLLLCELVQSAGGWLEGWSDFEESRIGASLGGGGIGAAAP